MKPFLSIFTMTSVDGRYASVPLDVGLYYETAADYGADAVLVGADTALHGLAEMPEETADDRHPPERSTDLPWLVLVDSRGRLRGNLHGYRAMPYCRDVLVLVSETTPSPYLDYLRDRQYATIVAGAARIDLRMALESIARRYAVGRVRADAGGALACALLNAGLVDELVLLVAPLLGGNDASVPLFDRLAAGAPLQLQEHRALRDGHVLLRYACPHAPSLTGEAGAPPTQV